MNYLISIFWVALLISSTFMIPGFCFFYIRSRNRMYDDHNKPSYFDKPSNSERLAFAITYICIFIAFICVLIMCFKYGFKSLIYIFRLDMEVPSEFY